MGCWHGSRRPVDGSSIAAPPSTGHVFRSRCCGRACRLQIGQVDIIDIIDVIDVIQRRLLGGVDIGVDGSPQFVGGRFAGRGNWQPGPDP